MFYLLLVAVVVLIVVVAAVSFVAGQNTPQTGAEAELHNLEWEHRRQVYGKGPDDQ